MSHAGALANNTTKATQAQKISDQAKKFFKPRLAYPESKATFDLIEDNQAMDRNVVRRKQESACARHQNVQERGAEAISAIGTHQQQPTYRESDIDCQRDPPYLG